MRIEWWLLLAAYIMATILLFLIPKDRMRGAVVAILFTQVITFLLGLAAVQLELLAYPIRLFPSINRASFTYEYYVLPVTCAFFNDKYPDGRSFVAKLAYYIGFSTVLTVAEVILEKYTNLIKYIHWEWYTSWITICLTFLFVRLFCNWFFAKKLYTQTEKTYH